MPLFGSQMRSAGRETIERPGVNFYGPFGIVGGLGSAGRGYLDAFWAAGISVSVIPVNEMFVHHPSVGKAAHGGQRPRYPISLVQANANSVRRFLHFRSGSFARARYRIGLWVWELPALRDEWWSEIDHFDEIWVPSTFCQRAVQAVTKKPVKVVPYVVSAVEPERSGWREKLQIDKTAFVFLYMFDAASFVIRKNPQCLIDAFDSTFADHPGVRLLLKVSNADLNPGFSEYLDALVRRDARCVVLRQTMPAHELAGLVRACNCYVSPHRSEGFGLTVAEAMAQGVPAIATDYGGAADFVTDEVGFPLRYRLIEVERGDGPYPKGAIWADPSREHLQELLRLVVANPQAAAVKGEAARARIFKDYSAAAVGRLIEKRLHAIAAR